MKCNASRDKMRLESANVLQLQFVGIAQTDRDGCEMLTDSMTGNNRGARIARAVHLMGTPLRR
jgi:hypothetical protein